MLDLLILCNQRHGLTAREFCSLLAAVVDALPKDDQRYFERAGWDGAGFPETVTLPSLLDAVQTALDAVPQFRVNQL